MTTMQTPIGDQVQQAAAAVVERVLTELRGSVYSPRIRLLTIEQVHEATGIATSTIYEMIEKGKFPKPQREIGRNRWRESAIISWLDRNDPNLPAERK